MSPIRSESHMIGEQAVDIVKRSLPKHWIVRYQGGDNDYGIDIEVELVQTNKEVSGIIIKGQVKGHNNINFDENGIYSKSMSTDKLKYWLSFKMPVLLFVVDVTSEEVYWIDIQQSARRSFKYLDSQENRIIRINSNSKITQKSDTSAALALLIRKALYDYDWRDTFAKSIEYFRKFIQFLQIWEKCKFYDFHMEMDPIEVSVLKNFYKETIRMANVFYVAIDDTIIPFEHLYEEVDSNWNGSFVYLIGLNGCNHILPYILQTLDFIKELVTKLEVNFWKKYNEEFQSFVDSFELPSSIEEQELLGVLSKYSN